MKKTKIFKRVLIFVMVFSLVISIAQPRKKADAGLLTVLRIGFLLSEVVECVTSIPEGKGIEGCTPLVLDVLTSGFYAYIPWLKNQLGKRIVEKFSQKSILNIVKISNTEEQLRAQKDFIVGTYSKWCEAYKGIKRKGSIEIHHLLEKRDGRIADLLGFDMDEMLSIPMSTKMHQTFTNDWKKVFPTLSRSIPYKKDFKSLMKLKKGIDYVYRKYPALKRIAKAEFYSSNVVKEELLKVYKARTKKNVLFSTPFVIHKIFPTWKHNTTNVKDMDAFNKFDPEYLEAEVKEKLGIDLNNPDLYIHEAYDSDNKSYLNKFGEITFDFSKTNNTHAKERQVGIEDLKDITREFADKTVRMKSVYTGNPVRVDDEHSVIHAKHYPSDKDIIFQTQLTPDNWLGFKRKDGKWLSASSSGASRLKVNADALYAWECFRIYTDGTNHYIYSQKTKKVITVSDKISSILSADDENFERAKFIIEDVNENKGIKLRAPDTGIPENWGNVDFSSNQGFHPIATEESYVTDKHYIKTAYIRGYYTGSWRNGVPNGFGTLVYDDASLNKQIDGIQYSGEFVDGVPIGKGQKIFETYKLDGNFYGFFAHNKTVFDGKIIYTKGQDAGRVFKVRQVGVGDRDSKFVDWEEIKRDSYDSLVEGLKDIPESSPSYTKGEHLDEGWVGGSTSISNHSTNQIDFVPSYELKNIDAKTYMPSCLGNYVENKHYVFSNFIRGHYTGNWENGKPSGYGTLVYDDYSENKKNGWIEYRGEFSCGIPFGNGQKIHKEYYLDGRFYGLFKAGKKVFEGKIVYTKGADAGRQCTATQIATGATTSNWTDMVEITE